MRSNTEDINQANPREEYQTDMEDYECKRCGYFYNPSDITPPPSATMYWEPRCPYCKCKMTSTVIDDIMMESANWTLNTMPDDAHEKKREWIDRMQAWARHLHGKEVHEYADR